MIVCRSIVGFTYALPYEVWLVSEQIKTWRRSESDVISDKFNV
jgi:hypothetical protein